MDGRNPLHTRVWLKNKKLGLRVLVVVSIYQGAILMHVCEPQPVGMDDTPMR